MVEETTENKNLVGLDSLNNYLSSKPATDEPRTSSPAIAIPSVTAKSSLSILEETNAKIKMLEVGGNVAEKLLNIGNQIVDKIIKAKQMQFMAEQQEREAQNPQKQLIPSPAPAVSSEMVYTGFVQILEFFLSIDKELKVEDLLAECKEKKELALQMINKFMANQQQPQAEKTDNTPAHVQESLTAMKKEERLKNAS